MTEHQIQSSCIRWFRYQYPQLSKMLIAVPNQGKRNTTIGRRFKDEGMIAGVSDLLLLVSCGGYGCLCVEMKRPKGKPTEKQEEWLKQAEMNGNKTAICHSLDEFIEIVTNYIKFPVHANN